MSKEYSSSLNIKPLDASLQRLASNFHCGNIYIDSFLTSSQALDAGFGKTFVWLEDGDRDIVGFYNISVGSIDQYDGNSRYKIGGAIHINEFAIALRYRGVSAYPGADINLSDLLLKDILERVKYLRNEHIGFSFITLQSTDDGRGLYSRNDFEGIEEDMDLSILQGVEEKCIPMYYPLDIE